MDAMSTGRRSGFTAHNAFKTVLFVIIVIVLLTASTSPGTDSRDLTFDFTPPHAVNHYVGGVRRGEAAPPQHHKTPLADHSEGLKLLKEAGEYQGVHEKWPGVHRSSPADLAPALRWVAVSFSLLLLLTTYPLWSRTLRKQAAARTAELRRNKEKYRLLAHNTTEGRFACVDLSAVNLFRASAHHELTGAIHLDRVHADFRDTVRDRLRGMIREKTAIPPLEQVFLRMDGTTVDVEVSNVPIRYEGRDGALVFVRGVSERIEREKAHKALQAQLLPAQKMEALGRLAGGVAQDYNNMLSVITGYAEMALDQVAPEAPSMPNSRKSFRRQSVQPTSLASLWPSPAYRPSPPRVPDLSAIVKSMLKMLRRPIGEDVDLAWLPDEELWALKIDPDQLDQIMANLCGNVRDAIASAPSQAPALILQLRREIDLLITDVVMPEMNGRKLSGRLRPIFPSLKTLFMSGYTADVIAHRGVLDDGGCFIRKPFTKQGLAAKVREAFDNAEMSPH